MNQARWHKLSLAEQIGNIGSEISRARKDKTAFIRILNLIDLTLKKYKLKEITRLREVICDIYLKTSFYNISLTQLESFYLPFAIKARQS